MSNLVKRLKAKAEDCEGEDRLDLRPDAAVMREAITAIEAMKNALHYFAVLALLNNTHADGGGKNEAR